MKKFINLLIKVFMCVIYCPCWIVRTILNHRRMKKYASAGVIKFEFDFDNMLCLPLMASDIYKDGEYTIFILRDYYVPGIVCVVEKMQAILVGHEMADEFMEDTLLAKSILLHEKGHVEAPGGHDRTRLWYNPEDWVYNKYTPAEMTADRWAVQHGADGNAMIHNLKEGFWYKPVTRYIRIQNIRRCMAAAK